MPEQQSESKLLSRLLVRASELGARVFRNQVGSYQLPDGRWLSSGLCVGSSDLIGFLPVTVTPEMVGTTVAVFVALETKVGRRDTTLQQAAFIAKVKQSGGIAVVVRDIADAEAEFKKYTLAR